MHRLVKHTYMLNLFLLIIQKIKNFTLMNIYQYLAHEDEIFLRIVFNKQQKK